MPNTVRKCALSTLLTYLFEWTSKKICFLLLLYFFQIEKTSSSVRTPRKSTLPANQKRIDQMHKDELHLSLVQVDVLGIESRTNYSL